MKRKFLGLLFVLMLTFVVTGCSLGEIDVPVNVVTNAPVDLDEVYINVVSQIPNKDAITGDITLPTKFGSVVVVWSSNNPDLIDAQGHVHRPEVDTQVTLTCILSDGKNQKTYQLSLTVKAEEIVVSVIEPISDILRADAETNHKAKGVVYALSNVSFVLKDSSGMILVYLDTDYRNDLAVGDEVEVEGATSLYGGNLQFNRPAYSKVGTKSVSHGTPVELDVAKYEALANGAPIQFVTFEAKLVVSGKYTNLEFPGSSISGSIASPIQDVKELSGKNVKVTGYFVYVTQSAAGAKYIYFVANEIKEVGGGEVTPPEPPVVEEKAIAQILSGTVGDTYKTKATVIATSTVSFLLKDSTGMILAYVGESYAKDLAVGDVVLVEAMTSTYSGTIQLGTTSAAPVYSKVETASVSYPTPRELSGADIDALVAQTAPTLEYVTIKGVLTISGKYLNVTIDGTTVKGSLATDKDLTALNGKAIIATGYYLYSTSRGAYANIIVTSVEEDTSAVITPIDASTIAQVLEGTVGSTYKVENATVVALCSRGMVLADNTGLIFAFVASGFKYDSFSIGQKVTVEGSSSLYNKRVQFNSPSITAGESGSYTQPEPIVLDGPALEAKVSGELIDCALVQVTGKAAFGNYYNIAVEGTNIQAAIAYPYQDLSEFNEKDVVVTGYLVYLSSGKYAYLVLVDIEEVQVAPKTDEELLAEAVERLAQWNTGSVMRPILPTEFDDLGVNLSWKLVVDVPMEEDGSWWPYKYSDEEAVFDVTLTKGELSEVVEIRFVMKALSTTSDLQAMSSDELDADYFAVQGIVVAVYNKGFLVNDGQGYILTYLGNNYNEDLKVGDVIVERGVVNKYGGFSQFSSFVGYKVLDEDVVTAQYLPADGDTINNALDNPMILPVEVKGYLYQSGDYLNLTIEGTTIIGSVLTSEDLSEYVDNNVIVRGYFVYFSSNNTFANMILSDIEIDENAQPIVLELSTIAEVKAGTEGERYLVQGEVVAASGVGFIIQDETGYIQIYYGNNNYPRVQYGDIVKAQGTMGVHGGVAQLTNPSFEITGHDDEYNANDYLIDEKDYLNGAGVEALVDSSEIQYFAVVGTLSISGSYLNLKLEDSDVIVSIVKPSRSDLSEYNGKTMVFMGYYVYTAKSSDGSKVYVNMMSLLYGEYFYDRTIAEVLTSNPGSYAVEGTVVAIGRTGFLLADETGYIFSYMGPDFHSGYGNMRVGQELVVYGKTSLYGGRIQFSNPLFDYGDFNAEYVQPEPTALSAQEFADLALAETVNVEYITIEGILKRSGNYYNIDLGDIGVTASLVDPEIAFAGEGAIGDKVIFTGYYIYTTENKEGNKYGYIVMTSYEVTKTQKYSVTVNLSDTDHASFDEDTSSLSCGFWTFGITLDPFYVIKSVSYESEIASVIIDGPTLVFYLGENLEINVEIANVETVSFAVNEEDAPIDGHTLIFHAWAQDYETKEWDTEDVVATYANGKITGTFTQIAPQGIVIAELKDGETELDDKWENVLRQSVDLDPTDERPIVWANHGTAENPISIYQVWRQGEALPYGNNYSEDYFVVGKIEEITADAEYDNIYQLVLTNDQGDRIIVSSISDTYGTGNYWTSDAPFAIGDEIVVLANIQRTNEYTGYMIPTLNYARLYKVNGNQVPYSLTFGSSLTNGPKEGCVYYVSGIRYVDGQQVETLVVGSVQYSEVVASFDMPQEYYAIYEYVLAPGETEPSNYANYTRYTEYTTERFARLTLHYSDEISYAKETVINEDGSRTFKFSITLSDRFEDPVITLTDLVAFGYLDGAYGSYEAYKEESIILKDRSNLETSFDNRVFSISVTVSKELFDEYTSVYYYSDAAKGTFVIDLYMTLSDNGFDYTLENPTYKDARGFYGSFGFFTSYVDVVEGVEHKGTLEDPLTANEAYLIASYLPDGVYSLAEFYIEGAVRGVDDRNYFYDYYLDRGEQKEGYLVWGMYTADGKYRYGTTFNQVESAGFEEGDVIVVCGIIEHYVNDSGNSVLRTPVAKLIKVNGEEATYTVISE